MAIVRAQLEQLIEDLGAIPAELGRELRPAIRKGSQPVVGQMKANASWSTRIPGAVNVRASFGGRPGVRIYVDARRAPHARPYEGLSGDPFRHPLWGRRDRPWVAQAARPFFFRAVEQQADRVAEAIADAVTEAARRHGFH